MPDKDELLYKKRKIFETISDEEKALADAYCEEYKNFLNKAKTERESVAQAIRLAERQGFAPLTPGMDLKAGSKVYSNIGGKALMLAIIGKAPLSDGVNIAAAHIDSPRLDLKQEPLYEDGDLAFFKTQYYGGIKKYQWVAQPLSLHGVLVKKNGEVIHVAIGEDKDDPVFVITDLLPHLGKDQYKKNLGEAIPGESLNLLIGSQPTGEEKDENRVKRTIMKILNEKYGITEQDFMSAELEAVPLMDARDVGFDGSMIVAYGHDDRSCAYAALKAILDLEAPEMTAVCVLADKEETGSDGVSGMQSAMFEDFIEELCEPFGVKPRACLKASFCLSADVSSAFDPNFPDVSDKLNTAKLGCGVAVMKYSGARGKGGTSEASAEAVAMLRSVFDENGVAWQMASLGKVDQGGGGTIAKYMANRNVETIDVGVPVLSMHAPYEIASKLDCYMTYKGILANYKRICQNV
ncbi:MAG: aminopeptidase [Oscillospiraceae bacterium]|nr:aminopeptidase [Oscillospiraceae bacterium]